MTPHLVGPSNGAVLAVTCMAITLTGCAGGVTPPAVLEISCPNALLRLDQVTGPGFQLQTPAPPGGGLPAELQPSGDGLRSAAEVHYFRPTRDLATSNGPIEVMARAACYRDTASASRALGEAAARRSHLPGEVAVSAGPLGDEARASRRSATLPSGTAVAQVTLEWRLASVLNTLTVRGRDGAFGLSDVLTLAARQQENELATTTPP